jgi:Fe2+ transport system protein B
MWLEWLWEGFCQGLDKLVGLWWLVLLFIGIQILKDSGWLAKMSRWMRPLLRSLRLPDDAALPVVAGLGIGVTYGSGVILQAAEEGKLTAAELTVTCVFVGICHAVIEETVLFAAAGTNGALLLAVRAATGYVFGWLASRLLVPPA